MYRDNKDFPGWLSHRAKKALPGRLAHATMMPNDVARPQASDAPAHAMQSAVLMLLYPHAEQWHIVLIVRSDDGGPHGGQLALPGGRAENVDADLIATAFRESVEEIALPVQAAEYVATLSPLYIPVSNFLVTPIVAAAAQLPLLHPSDAEVAAIRYVPLQDMYDSIADVSISTSQGLFNVKAYTLEDGGIVWGATAMMLSELGVLWREFLKR